MPLEQLVNSYTSALSAAIGAGDTSLVVASAAGAPGSGNFRIIIDSEIIIVGAVAGTTFSSLTRGAEGTTAAAHAAGSELSAILTAGALTAWRPAPGVLGSTSTKLNDIPANGTAKVFEVSVAVQEGQSVQIHGYLAISNNGVNYPVGTDTHAWLARGGTNLHPGGGITYSTALWGTTHTLGLVDTPGAAGTYAYQLYGRESGNRTAPTFLSGFLQVAAL
jgi:hypothetical protein